MTNACPNCEARERCACQCDFAGVGVIKVPDELEGVVRDSYVLKRGEDKFMCNAGERSREVKDKRCFFFPEAGEHRFGVNVDNICQH